MLHLLFFPQSAKQLFLLYQFQFYLLQTGIIFNQKMNLFLKLSHLLMKLALLLPLSLFHLSKSEILLSMAALSEGEVVAVLEKFMKRSYLLNRGRSIGQLNACVEILTSLTDV